MEGFGSCAHAGTQSRVPTPSAAAGAAATMGFTCHKTRGEGASFSVGSRGPFAGPPLSAAPRRLRRGGVRRAPARDVGPLLETRSRPRPRHRGSRLAARTRPKPGGRTREASRGGLSVARFAPHRRETHQEETLHRRAEPACRSRPSQSRLPHPPIPSPTPHGRHSPRGAAVRSRQARMRTTARPRGEAGEMGMGEGRAAGGRGAGPAMTARVSPGCTRYCRGAEEPRQARAASMAGTAARPQG